jgi:NADP-dependent 3-hydroxy acid dehydrogenase YdfG
MTMRASWRPPGVAPAMRDRGYGRIAAVSSIAGKEGVPGGAAYGASKAHRGRAGDRRRHLFHGERGVQFYDRCGV